MFGCEKIFPSFMVVLRLQKAVERSRTHSSSKVCLFPLACGDMNRTQDVGGEEQAPPPEAPDNVSAHPSPRQSSSAHDANGISLHEVAPVNLAVYHVSITIGENADSKSAFFGAFGKGKARDDME